MTTDTGSTILFERPGPKITIRDVEVFERLIGERLPDDYRTYLLTNNGAFPYKADFPEDRGVLIWIDWQGKPPKEYGGGRLVEVMCKLLNDASNTSDLAYHVETFKDRIPDDTIAIGRNPGGSLFLLGIRGGNRGKVFFWDRRYETVQKAGDIPTYDNVGFAASNFDEFLNRLEAEPDDWDAWEQAHAR